MAGAWIPVVGTLGGALLGALAAYATQLAQWRRQFDTRWDTTRMEAFANFLNRANSYHVALRNLAWALRKDRAQVQNRRMQVDDVLPDLLAAKSQVDILTGGRVAGAANDLLNHLQTVNGDLYGAESDREGSPLVKRGTEMDADFARVRDAFAVAVRTALGTTQPA